MMRMCGRHGDGSVYVHVPVCVRERERRRNHFRLYVVDYGASCSYEMSWNMTSPHICKRCEKTVKGRGDFVYLVHSTKCET